MYSLIMEMLDFDLTIMNNLNIIFCGYRFSSDPKTILIFCPNSNKSFYNWMLNNWKIKRVPRMYSNEEEKRFVEESPTMALYKREKEDILGKEIESIKREVPKQYRKEYFRKKVIH